MITWPHALATWGASAFHQIQDSLRQIVAHVAPTQTVVIVCCTQELMTCVAADLEQLSGDIRFIHAPSNDIWARDHGPLSCRRSEYIEFLDFQFNGWGAKYPAQHDNRITSNLHTQHLFQTNVLHHNFVLEGGSIESDGRGTLLTTAACLQHPKRNPGYTRPDITQYLRRHTGARRILWLEHGYLAGDDTDSHIDNLARFLNPDTIAYCACDDRRDEQYTELQHMKRELQAFNSAQGRPYQLIPLPLPNAMYNAQGQRLPASYANFLVTNDYVFVPQFDDDNDTIACDQLGAHFPDRTLVQVNSTGFIQQYGGIHCATMNLFGKLAP